MNKKSSYEMMLNRPKHQCSKPDCGSKERISFASVHDKTERGSTASLRQILREKNKLKLTRNNDFATMSSQKCNPPALTTSASSNFLCQEQQRNLLKSAAKAQNVP